MAGLSDRETSALQAGDIHVCTLQMAVLTDAARAKARHTAHYGEDVLEGAGATLATYLAKSREALRRCLRETDRHPATANMATLRQLPAKDAIDLLNAQRAETLEMIQKDIAKILSGASDCERLFGIEHPIA